MSEFRRRLLMLNALNKQDDENEYLGRFILTVNSGSSKSVIIPTMGSRNGSYTTYNWTIDWGDGTTDTYSGTGSNGSGISHSFPLGYANYDVEIKPTDSSELGWLMAFGFSVSTTGSGAISNREKFLKVDGGLTANMVRRLASDTYVLYQMFYNCTNITMGDYFNLPQDISSASDFFASHMFYNCNSLKMGKRFNMPQSLTSVSNRCFQYMLTYCTSLAMNDIFTMPQKLESAGNYFAFYMFRGCTNIKAMGLDFNLSQSLTAVGDCFCAYTFYDCTNVTMNNIFTMPKNIVSTGIEFAYSIFYNCKAITMNSVFNLPQKLTTASVNFFSHAFYGCSNLEMNNVFTAPQNLTSVANQFFYFAFHNCIKIKMGSAFNLPQKVTSVGTYFFGSAFMGCTGLTFNSICTTPPLITSVDSGMYYRIFFNCTSMSKGALQFFGKTKYANAIIGSTDFCYQGFYACTALLETINYSTTPMVSIIPAVRNYCFNGCPDSTTVNLPTNWK